jgi:hypothetical protein
MLNPLREGVPLYRQLPYVYRVRKTNYWSNIVFGRASGSDVCARGNAHKADKAFGARHRVDRVIFSDQCTPPDRARILLSVIRDARQGDKIRFAIDDVSRSAHDLQFGMLIEELIDRKTFQLYINGFRYDRSSYRKELQLHAIQYASTQAKARQTRLERPPPPRKPIAFHKVANGKIEFHPQKFKYYVVPLFEARDKLDPDFKMPAYTLAKKVAAFLNKRHFRPSHAKRYTAELVVKHLANSAWIGAYCAWKLSMQPIVT